MARKLGITSKLDGFYAEALGGTTNCCTVLEMSNAYATIANGGTHHDPTAIRRVVFPRGEVEKLEDREGNRVISDGVAYEVADVMKGPLDSGTARRIAGCEERGRRQGKIAWPSSATHSPARRSASSPRPTGCW